MNPSALEKTRWPLSQVSLTTPLSVLFWYGEILLRKSIVDGSTCITISTLPRLSSHLNNLPRTPPYHQTQQCLRQNRRLDLLLTSQDQLA
jgi:hypothetical protein